MNNLELDDQCWQLVISRTKPFPKKVTVIVPAHPNFFAIYLERMNTPEAKARFDALHLNKPLL